MKQKFKDMPSPLRRYLHALSRHLLLPREIRDQVLGDLITGICARLESGESSAEILKGMDSPRQAAEGINQEMADYAYRRSPWRYLFLGAGILGILGLGYTSLLQLLGLYLISSDLQEAASVGIIGGADGPTAICVTTSDSMHTFLNLLPFLALAVIGLAGFFWLRRMKPRKHHKQ